MMVGSAFYFMNMLESDDFVMIISTTMASTENLIHEDESTTFKESTNEDPLDAYREMSFAMACAMLIICSLSVLTNSLSIFVYTDKSLRRTPINILLTGLSAIDLSLSILSIPAFIVPGFFTYYPTWILEWIMCYSAVFVYPLTATTQTASVWTFVVIAVERWHAVQQGGRDMVSVGRQRSLLRRQRRRTCVYALIIVCILSLAYNAVRFFEFELVYNDAVAAPVPDSDSLVPTPDTAPLYTMPMIVPLLRNSTTHPFYMPVYFVGLYMVTHFAIPFICLVAVNGLTLRIVYIAKQRRKKLLTRRERKEHRTTQMMITVVVMFILCYVLLFTLNIIEAADSNWFHTDENRLIAYALNDISNILVVTNAASTAIIYYIFNRRYRELCLALISKLFTKISLWCCWCSWCWSIKRSCQDFFDRRQRAMIDRRRSTLISTTINQELVHEQTTEIIFMKQRLKEESSSTMIENGLHEQKRTSTSLLVVPTFSVRKLSSSSTLDNMDEFTAL